MKLKKIVSLALAGVLAVSMLAGCKNDGTENDGASSNTTPVVTTFTSTVYGKLDEDSTAIMKTKDSSYLKEALAYAASNLDTQMVNAAIAANTTAAIELKGAGNADPMTYNASLLISINRALNGTSGTSYTVKGYGATKAGSALTKGDLSTDGKYIAVYQYDRSLSDSSITTDVASKIDGLVDGLPVQVGTTYYSYYVTAESATVGTSNGAGSVFVAVMIEVDSETK